MGECFSKKGTRRPSLSSAWPWLAGLGGVCASSRLVLGWNLGPTADGWAVGTVGSLPKLEKARRKYAPDWRKRRVGMKFRLEFRLLIPCFQVVFRLFFSFSFSFPEPRTNWRVERRAGKRFIWRAELLEQIGPREMALVKHKSGGRFPSTTMTTRGVDPGSWPRKFSLAAPAAPQSEPIETLQPSEEMRHGWWLLPLGFWSKGRLQAACPLQ